MKIEASDKEVQDIFSSGYFKIPRFQRPYSWGREEVERFWDDVVGSKDQEYFIGSMVVFQTKRPYFGVVDGQQRLTTITIALSVIRDAFLAIEASNLAKGVHQFIEKPNNDFEDEFVLNTETSFPYFQSHIQSFHDVGSVTRTSFDAGVEEQNLKAAFDLLSARLKREIGGDELDSPQQRLFAQESSVARLKEIRDKFLSLKLVFIQLDNEDDAYLIFETLNARGRDLRTSDLVKNLILKAIKSSNSGFDSPKEVWNGIIKGFSDISESDVVDSYLLHYWLSKHEYSTDKKLFQLIKEYVSGDSARANSLLRDLQESAYAYCKMLSPEACVWNKEEQKAKESLIALNTFKVRQQSSFVLALLVAHAQKRLTSRQLMNMLEEIERFHFVFNAITQQRSSGTIATMYSQHAIRLSSAMGNDEIQRILSSLGRELKSKLPSYDEFEVKFLELDYLSNRTRSKSIVRYALCKLLGGQQGGLDINHAALTIEHLIPEAHAKQKGVSPDLIGSIGNLVMVDGATNNSKLQDKEPQDKLTLLEERKYPMEANFLQVGAWGREQVEARAKKIAAFFYSS